MTYPDFMALPDIRVLAADLETPPELVFLLVGTSNAGGTNSIVTRPYVGPDSTSNVYVCDKWVQSTKRATFVSNDPTPAWIQLTESMGMTPGTWGPEVTLGLELERIIGKALTGWVPGSGPSPCRIRIIKLGVSFAALHADAANPLLEFNDRDNGTANTAHELLNDYYLKEYINLSRASNANGTYFGGVFSVLGETDTLGAPYGTGSSHLEVEANISELHDLILDRVNVTHAPWVASMPMLSLPADTRINATANLIFDPTRILAVRTGLENFRDRLPYKRWTELVDPSDLQVTGHVGAKDGLHLTGTGQHEMGRRMAAAWHKIVERNVLYRIQADLA